VKLPSWEHNSHKLLSAVSEAALLAASPPTQQPGNTRKELETSVCARALAWLTGDFDSYFRLTTGNYRWSGDPIRQWAQPEPGHALPFEMDDLRVVVCSDLYIVSYVLTVYRDEERDTCSGRWQRTEVWILEGGHWKAAAADSRETFDSE